jgi:Skp family chaperone for outer membrane proteins
MRIPALTLCTLIVASAAAAQTPPAQATPPPAPKPAEPPAPFPEGAKFAFVDLQFVAASSRIGQAGLAQLRKIQETRDAQLQSQAKELAALEERYKSQQGLLSADALRALGAEIDLKQRRLQFDSQTRDADLQRMGRDLLDDFSARVMPIVEAVRKERGLLVIFGVRQEPGGLEVVSADPGLDLTAEIIKRLDAGAK